MLFEQTLEAFLSAISSILPRKKSETMVKVSAFGTWGEMAGPAT